MSQWLAYLGVGAALILSLIALWRVPKRQVAALPSDCDPQTRLDIESKCRATLAQIVAGTVLLAGLLFTWHSLRATQKSVILAEEGQIAERFTRAIDRLGTVDRLEVRLGGIYALERIARDSEKDHWTVMEVLTACVRQNAPRTEEKAEGTDEPSPPPADTEAILTVIGRRRTENEAGLSRRLDLSRTNMATADLVKAKLWGGADLSEADLMGADLTGTNLARANMYTTNLIGVNLTGTDLTRANSTRSPGTRRRGRGCAC